MTVLLDNTVLSNFSIVGRPDLVRMAFVEQVGTTEQALREMQDGVAIGKVPECDWQWLARVTLTPHRQRKSRSVLWRITR
jgi:predicted nucleic acid-binding protein